MNLWIHGMSSLIAVDSPFFVCHCLTNYYFATWDVLHFGSDSLHITHDNDVALIGPDRVSQFVICYQTHFSYH